MGSFWSCSRVVLGSAWSRPEVVLGSFWGCPEIVLESSWGRPGVVLESFSSRSGGVLEHFESVLVRPGSVLDHFWLKQKSDVRAMIFLGAAKANRMRKHTSSRAQSMNSGGSRNDARETCARQANSRAGR